MVEQEKQLPQDVIIKSTNAIGDSVMESATVKALGQKGMSVYKRAPTHLLSLWEGLPNAHSSEQDLPAHVPEVDVSTYQDQFPHTSRDPHSGTFLHLSEWIGGKAEGQLGTKLSVSSEDVQLILTVEEARWGFKEYQRRLHESGNSLGVIISPNATTGNRSLTQETVREIAAHLLENDVTPFLLTPLPEGVYDEIPAERIGDQHIRKAASLLWASDALVCVDSGPFHMANASLQGTTRELAEELGINTDPKKIVLITGSSNPEVVMYENNQTLHYTGNCPLSERGGCGCHGYYQVDQYSEHFGVPFLPSVNPQDKGGCIYDIYSKTGISPCMDAVSATEVFTKVMEYLTNTTRTSI